MTQESEDRRVQRTRKLLSDALVELMQEKHYDRITVQDIADRANVGRSTFYAHFENKDDLLVSDFAGVLDMLNQHIDSDSGDTVLNSLDIFRHIQMHHHLYRALLWGRGIELLFEQGEQHLAERIEAHLKDQLPQDDPESLPTGLVAHFLAGTLLTLVKWWLDNDIAYRPEYMDEMYRRLALPGVMALMEGAEKQTSN